MFDATIGVESLLVSGLDVDLSTGAHTVEVYIKTDSYVDFDTNPAAWTLVSASAVAGAGAGNATHVSLTPLTLASGKTYGVYVTLDPGSSGGSTNVYYTDGSATYSNADITLSLGDSLGGLFGSTFVFSDRIWNGAIDYSAVPTPEPASLLLSLALPGALLLRSRYLRKY
jgi:hypothetical protein